MHHRSDQLITVRDKGGTYTARFRGKTASCTWSAGHAAQSVAAKALGHPVTVRCLDSDRLYQIVASPAQQSPERVGTEGQP